MRVPAGTTSLSLPVSGDHSEIIVTAWLRTPDGRDIPVPLSDNGTHLTGAVPAAGIGATLFALDVDETGHLNTIQQHHFGEGASSQAVLAGTVHIGLPTLAGASWQDWGSSGARATVAGSTPHGGVPVHRAVDRRACRCVGASAADSGHGRSVHGRGGERRPAVARRRRERTDHGPGGGRRAAIPDGRRPFRGRRRRRARQRAGRARAGHRRRQRALACPGRPASWRRASPGRRTTSWPSSSGRTGSAHWPPIRSRSARLDC